MTKKNDIQKKSKKSKKLNYRTDLVHSGIGRSQYGETSEALFLTQGFVYDSAESARRRFANEEDGYVYSRYGNPTVRMFEDRICCLEGASGAYATSSGMSAVTSSLLCYLRSGDHVVSSRALFGSCRYVIESVLPRFGIEVSFVDGTDLDAWESSVRANTRLFFLETPTNPTLDIIDILGVSGIAKASGALLVVDNVFATPLYQKPLALGADIVVYSATKHIDGQGRCLGGVVLASDESWLSDYFHDYFRHTGPCMSPFNAWVLLKGLETLPVRVDAQTRSAELIADFLGEHKKINRVMYPFHPSHPQHNIASKQMTGGSTLVSFEIQGGRDAAFAFEDKLNIIKLSNNLGDTKSLVTHPATTTHKNLAQEERDILGISDGLVRLSVGLEDCDDLIGDISSSLG